MRRTITTIAALALLATTPAASGSPQTYEGEIANDAESSVELVIKQRDGKRFVTKFAVRNFLLSCEGGTDARLARATLEGSARITGKGRFRMKASNQAQRLRAEGRIKGRNASGTVRYSGLTEFPDQSLECRSGEVRWTAVR